MNQLNWNGSTGNVAAVGRFGIYTIQSVGPDMHVLQGIGHDELSMHALPSLGYVFKTLTQAQEHAATLDRTMLPEPEMSGE